MKTTKQDSFIVVSMAWRSRVMLKRLRLTAISKAPTAPMAPPSVGVAMPRKMVPSTRKISASGGISTKVTRSAMRDSRCSLNSLLASARKKAMPTPTDMAPTISSSVGISGERVRAKTIARVKEMTTSTPSERSPGVPSSSRIERASCGRAGAHCGRHSVMPRM